MKDIYYWLVVLIIGLIMFSCEKKVKNEYHDTIEEKTSLRIFQIFFKIAVFSKFRARIGVREVPKLESSLRSSLDCRISPCVFFILRGGEPRSGR